ncbi:hypothetical protein F0919_07980 [Taibaiella lutea]|uniref:Pectate lyase superfamily protein domain-containing protein n=1 Tax=Taibaiella lutea TaxID=2608001 RepID=A0A5M6CJC7_9BACT|nr:hypothetical protein [Taibaiella lutea]KAA5534550.1 hypothetical protein F0919_07980 [Taibaiella lutea]
MILQTIADLQALSTIPSDNHAHVLGYNTPADGGGGDFYWDAASQEPLNYGTVFDGAATTLVSGVPTGKWVRYYSESINLKWFGAVGDGATNDSSALQKMIDFCERTGVKDVVIPFGYFYLEESVHVKIGGIKFTGQGSLLREESAWEVMKNGGNSALYPGAGFPFYSTYNYSDTIAYKGSMFIVENNISGIIYDASVCDSVYWRGIGFRAKSGRQAGNTYAIDFRSQFKGPTWPFNVHECYFSGFNRVFNFSSGAGNLYDIASINITHCAFKQNDEVLYQGFYINPGNGVETNDRYICWGLNFQNNKCHDNSRIIYGSFAKDLVTISDNNLEGNIHYSDSATHYAPYVIDLEISFCSVKFHGNHFEGQASDCVSISSLQKKADDTYKGTETSTYHYVDIYGNNFDGVVWYTGFKPYTLTGCVVKINERTPIYVHACEILENGNSPVYMTPYALTNGTIIKFSDKKWLSSNFVKGINSYGITNNSNEQSFLENGEQFIRTTRDTFGLGSPHSFIGDVKYCISVYKSRSNLPRTITHSALCSFKKDGVILNPGFNGAYGIGGPPRGESLIVCIFPSDGLFTNTSSNSFAVGLSSQVGSSELVEFSSSTFMYTTKESNPLIVPLFEPSEIINEIGTFEKGQTWFNGTETRIATGSGTVGAFSIPVTVEEISDNKIRLNYAYFIAKGQFIEINHSEYRIIELIEVPDTINVPAQPSTFWITLDAIPSGVNVGDEITFHAPTFSNLDSAPDISFLRMPPNGDYTASRSVFFTPSTTNFDNLLTSGVFFDANNTSGTSPFGDRYGIFYNAYAAVDTGYGFQFGADTHYASIDGDKFVYRNRVGTTWQPWNQVASREWSNQAFIQNQNTSAQSANAWISGNFITDSKIGIGTSSPAGVLDISGSGGNTVSIIRNTTATGYSDLRIMNDLNSTVHMLAVGYTGSSYPGSYWSGGISGEVGAVGTIGNYPFEIGTNNTSRISVLTNGNVGIATTSPAQKLDVDGTIRQSEVTSAMLKANSSGDIVAAVSGTDYANPADIETGTYNPTITGSDTYTASKFLYTKVKNHVHVSGHVDVTLSGPTANHSFVMDLPISANITVEDDLTGTVSGTFSSYYLLNILSNFIEGNVASDKATVHFVSGETAKVYVQFDYIIQ